MDYVQLSKTVSHALRHDPASYGLVLDLEGWATVDALLQGLRQTRTAWRDVGEQDLKQMIRRSPKQRFEMRVGKIRALYGHSITTTIDRLPAAPPPVLFHGTSPENAEVIRKQGLKPMLRQHAHLSANRETARQVGRRKAPRPVILEISAATAAASGVPFYRAGPAVWLVDYVPPQFIRGCSR